MRVLSFLSVFICATLFEGASSADPNAATSKLIKRTSEPLNDVCFREFAGFKKQFSINGGLKCSCIDNGYFRCYQYRGNKKINVQKCKNQKLNRKFKGYRNSTCRCDKYGSIYCLNSNDVNGTPPPMYLDK
ncbi:hypothetical protein BB561_002913 [Smittium simulii]|uniref:Cyanovirin-N domain-containing protein n=1 Tax=Smittium simulii TaxID=133385 RepID=A0A2T9YNV8_9FUNG|nr:hypothetical protein BB561_002913 [Smittium simulii]